jgi:hypothetical protein
MSTPTVSRLSGTGYNQIRFPTKSPEQMDVIRQLMSGSSGNIASILDQLRGLSGGGDEEYWQQLEAPAQRQFGKLQGDIASRFSGMGSGARKSSGFQNAQSGAATDFAERLQSNRLGTQSQARNQLLELYSSLLGQDLSHTGLIPKKKSFLQELFGSLAGGAGHAAGGLSSLQGLF